MRIVLGLAVLSIALGSVAAGARMNQVGRPADAAVDHELEAEVRALASRLRCPTCRALSVYDSPSEIAREMRALIREKLQAGATPAEVEAYFVERYGEWILLQPPAAGFNWSVWLLPVALLAGGLAFVLLTVRRWVERGHAMASVAEGGDEEL